MMGHPSAVTAWADAWRIPAVLFVRSDSVYKSLRCDPWDIERDARNWPGGAPVVAHPPCRAWGRLRKFAKPRSDEKDLAHFAVAAVRTWGGVLEHPASSSLWPAADLPRPGDGIDRAGGWSLAVDQFWWGHRARKRTWLYIVGLLPRSLPAFDLHLGDAPCVIGGPGGPRNRGRHLPKIEREATPQLFATWLLKIASLSKVLTSGGVSAAVSAPAEALAGAFSLPSAS